MKDRLIGVREASKMLNITDGSVRELINRMQLPAMKISGRFVLKATDVKAYKHSESWMIGQERKMRFKEDYVE